MGHGLDERWGSGVWLLGSGKIQFVAATDVRHISTTDDFETVERNERGEAAIDGAVVAGKTGAAQGTLDDGEGGGGGMMGIPDRSTMSRTQWRRFREAAKRIQGRK
jgi:hypothetical protein